MQTTTVQPLDVPATQATDASARSDFLVGLALTAFIPAVFWIATFAGIAGLIGYTPDLGSLLLAGLAIAAFLGACFAVLSTRSN